MQIRQRRNIISFFILLFIAFLSSKEIKCYAGEKESNNYTIGTGEFEDNKNIGEKETKSSKSIEGKNTVVLPLNIIGNSNILTQDMFNKGDIGSRVPNTNTVFVVKYDFDLNDPDGNNAIIIPAGCTLRFEGGSLNNGKIYFSLTKIEGNAAMNKCVLFRVYK